MTEYPGLTKSDTSSTELLYSGSVGGGNAWQTNSAAPNNDRDINTVFIDGKVLLAGGNSNNYNPPAFYDPSDDTYTTGLAAMPTPAAKCGTVKYNGKAWFFAGENTSGTAISDVQVYDPSTDSWTTKTPMPVSNTGNKTAIVNGVAYSVTVGDFETARCFAYDLDTDTWTEKSSGNEASSGAFVASALDRVYVLRNGGGEYYDPSTDTWTSLSWISGDITSSGGAAEYNGNIHCIGGTDGSGNPGVYHIKVDPEAETNTRLADLPAGRRYVRADGDGNGRFWVVGGRNSSSNDTNTNYEYQPEQAPPVTLSENRLVGLRDGPSETAEVENQSTGLQGKVIAGKSGDDIRVTEDGNAEIYGI